MFAILLVVSQTCQSFRNLISEIRLLKVLVLLVLIVIHWGQALLDVKLVYLNFAQKVMLQGAPPRMKAALFMTFYVCRETFRGISDNLFGWLESKEQLLSQYCTSSCRAKAAKTLKAALDYGMSIVLLFWAKFR